MRFWKQCWTITLPRTTQFWCIRRQLGQSVPGGSDNKRNLCAHDECGAGDIDAVLAASDVVIDHIYHTKACQQAMMETFRTYCSIDTYGRLNVLSSTQIVFHARRNIANALHIPKSMVRVAKPRIGGGFGAKQTAVSEVYPAFVTWKTKKPSKIIFSRVESQIASSPRHEMEIHVRLGATKDGVVKGIDLYTLSNTGAYGEHGPTTVAFPVTSPSRCTARQKPSALSVMWCIRTTCLPVLTAVTAQRRDCLP